MTETATVEVATVEVATAETVAGSAPAVSVVETAVRETVTDSVAVLETVTVPVLETVTDSVAVIEIVEVARQGPRGPPGTMAEGEFLWTVRRLAEFDTLQAKAEARANLELQYIDCGTFT